MRTCSVSNGASDESEIGSDRRLCKQARGLYERGDDEGRETGRVNTERPTQGDADVTTLHNCLTD